MASEALTGGIEAVASAAAKRLKAASLVVGIAGTSALAFWGSAVSMGFAAGMCLGAFNSFWLIRIAKKGIALPAEKAGRFVAARYHIRFLATAGIMSALIAKGLFSPWPLVAGLTASIITTIVVMIISARQEAS